MTNKRIEHLSLTADSLATELTRYLHDIATQKYPNDAEAFDGLISDFVIDATEEEFVGWLLKTGMIDGLKDINNLDEHDTAVVTLCAKNVVSLRHVLG